MAGLLDNVADFFEGLFSNDPQALKAKRALREQAELLSGIRPPLYNQKADQVLVGFAQLWAQIHGLLQPLRDLFDKTLSNPERKVQDLTLGYLIETLADGDLAARRQALSFESLQARLAASAEPSKDTATLTAEANSILTDLRRYDNEKVQQDLEALFRLRALVGHSLIPLLGKFGFNAAVSGQHFQPVDGTVVLADLLDLYFVVEGMDFSPGLEEMLGYLLEKVGPSKAAENRRKTSSLLNRVRNLFQGPCSAAALLQLCRLIQRNPDLIPDTQKISERYVASYMNTLADRFARDRDRALREKNESTLEVDISTLFPGTPLLPLTVYNEETSEQLVEAGLPALSAVKALRILRSFCFAVLKTGYLDAVKLVVLNGFFSDKDWAQKLSDSLYACEAVLTRLETFDHGLENDSKIGLPALEKYLSGKVPVSSVPKQIVDKINRTALSLLEDEARVLSTTAQRVQEILTDYKLPQPQFVGNIKGLGGKDQRSLIENLINGYNKTAHLLRILKHFIVVKAGT